LIRGRLRFWFHDYENFAPAGPEMPERRPEQSVQEPSGGRERFRSKTATAGEGEYSRGLIGPAADDSNHGEDGQNALSHEMTARLKITDSHADQILSPDRSLFTNIGIAFAGAIDVALLPVGYNRKP